MASVSQVRAVVWWRSPRWWAWQAWEITLGLCRFFSLWLATYGAIVLLASYQDLDPPERTAIADEVIRNGIVILHDQSLWYLITVTALILSITGTMVGAMIRGPR